MRPFALSSWLAAEQAVQSRTMLLDHTHTLTQARKSAMVGAHSAHIVLAKSVGASRS